MILNSKNKFNALIIFLGLTWIFDGICQLQVKLLSFRFITQVINPMYSYRDGIFLILEKYVTNIFLSNTLLVGGVISLLQILIGLLIIKKSFRQLGLYSSVFWGLFIWVFGENFGGVFTYQYNPLMGSPGAALVYVLVALTLIISYRYKKQIVEILFYFWSIFWLSVLGFLLTSPLGAYNNLMIMAPKLNQLPSWLAFFDRWYLTALIILGPSLVNVLILFLLVVALFIYGQKALRLLAVYSGCFLMLIFWLVYQNAGFYYSGLMTDLNSGPLIILVGLMILLMPYYNLKTYLKRLENFLT